jgi:hypothetical protein
MQFNSSGKENIQILFQRARQGQVTIQGGCQTNVYDEIQCFVNTRYGAAPETALRLHVMTQLNRVIQ